ncbi:MAG: hypothetical protein FJ194_03255 [Gammaproteobacteria bacterium]|nr:hypothetical protein [Gammaproteobacteria bacterium]
MISRRRMLSNTAIATAVATTAGLGAATPRATSATPFNHGVASGDPLHDRVILWTRITPAASDNSIPVHWVIADDEALSRVVNGGEVQAQPWRDHCVKVDATGLDAGRTWYFQFECNGVKSPIGRTKTLPAGDIDAVKFAVASCSNYPFGYFNAYACIARRDDLDAVLHLGDYLYEYAPGEYGQGKEFGREHQPAREIVSLDDYRERHAQYKSDPDLQEAHRRHPWITVWDDHESTNNSWKDGAQNHNPDKGEGNWLDRRKSAERAYFEWMPIREQLGSRGSWTYRSFRYGNLCDLIMLDTRLHGRSEQISDRKDKAAIAAAGRSLLGADQKAWLLDELSASKQAGTRWRVLGQQCMFGQLPDAEGHVLNTDQWDGYPHDRQAVLDQLSSEGIRNTVILTGDIHTAWAMDITPNPFDPKAYDPKTGSGSLAVELVTTAVTSPAPFGTGEEAQKRERDTVAALPHLHWADFESRGYLTAKITPDQTHAEWWSVSTIAERSTEEILVNSMRTLDGRNHLEPGLQGKA